MIAQRHVFVSILLCVGLAFRIDSCLGGDRTGSSDSSNRILPSLVEITAQPARIDLDSQRSYQSLLVTAHYADQSTRDVTPWITVRMEPSDLIKIESERVIPLRDGVGKILIEWQDKSAAVQVEVRGVDRDPPVQFRNEVLQILTKTGCNSGRCHGSASGKDGFRLSLYGFDPEGDHFRLAREINGRRISLIQPESSLLLLKATGSVPHTGGECFGLETPQYDTLYRWIAEGAKPDGELIPQPVSIEVYPPHAVFSSPRAQQKMIVMAHFDNGVRRDVTEHTVFLSNNDSTAKVDEQGLITAQGPGAAFVLARFDQFTAGTSIVVRPGTPFVYQSSPAQNRIDELVDERLQFLNMLPSSLCNDEQFLRRSSLDLIGLPPTVEERDAFLANPSPDKRKEWIDALIERPEFHDLWVMRWAELLQIRTNNGVSPKGLALYDEWLRNAVHSGKTIDQIIKTVLPATGGTLENPATNYYQTETTPQLIAENVAQVFLGTRIQCAQCHNHPFDRWTMDDYYGFAAFFSQIGYKQAKDPRELTIFNLAQGSIEHPIPGRKVNPRFLGNTLPAPIENRDYREVVSQWLASKSNPAFRENIANIVWAHFLGTGIVEPYDDTRISNPPSNPALLTYLGDRLAQADFDIKPLVREICNSRTYQASTTRNDSNKLDEREFSHQKIRRLRAEVLLDLISTVTGTTDKFSGLPEGSRAVQVADGNTPNYFLTTFGRSTRATPCSCEVKTAPTLSQALHLLNGETTSGKIREGNLVGKMLEQGIAPIDIAKRLYRRALTRDCTDEELSQLELRLSESKNVAEELEDLFWAILNSNEFIFNH